MFGLVESGRSRGAIVTYHSPVTASDTPGVRTIGNLCHRGRDIADFQTYHEASTMRPSELTQLLRQNRRRAGCLANSPFFLLD